MPTQAHVEEIKAAAQSAQKLYDSRMFDIELFRFLKAVVKAAFHGLTQPKKEQEPQKIQIQVRGKPVYSAVIKDGELQDVKGKLAGSQMQKLKEYLVGEPGAQIGSNKSPEYKILINGETVLHANKGEILENKIPENLRSQFKEVISDINPNPTNRNQAQEVAKNGTDPSPVQPVASEASPATSNGAKPLPVTASAAESNSNLTADLKAAGLDDRTAQEVAQQVSRSNLQSPIIVIQQALPKDSPLHKLMFALKQGIHNAAGKFIGNDPTARSLKQDMRNLDVMQEAKVSLSILSDRPRGERSWSGGAYQLIEGKDGSFAIEAKGRGKILEFANGRIEGSATKKDLENFKQLNQFIEQKQSPVKQLQLASEFSR